MGKEQLGLFSSPANPENLLAIDGEAVLFSRFFPPNVSDSLFTRLQNEINWRQDYIRLYGKQVPLPRLTAWHGDMGKSYSYSGIDMRPCAWTPALLEVKASVERAAGVIFNSVLLNLYRTGQDCVAWHSDDEPELGPTPVIASVSFGCARVFQFKHRSNSELSRINICLEHGSLLIMRGLTQRHWLHQVPRTKKSVGPRINLTFRVIGT